MRQLRNPQSAIRNCIVVIGGPTGTGKTDVAFALAKKAGGEIISADSRQFYRELDIGTDKVPLTMRREIPHHLIDFLSLTETFNIYDFAERSFRLVKEIQGRGALPVIVGGSGLYLRALLKGIFHLPDTAKARQPSVRSDLEQQTTGDLYQELRAVDPVTAEHLHPNDRRRIRRALEVFHLTGVPMHAMQQQKNPFSLHEAGAVRYFILTRPREILYRRVEERIERMFALGWVEEVIRLKAAGLETALRAKAPIGYHEILDHLAGEYDLAAAKELIKKNTRNFAKRQLTWFRREPGEWLEILEGNEIPITRVLTQALSAPRQAVSEAGVWTRSGHGSHDVSKEGESDEGSRTPPASPGRASVPSEESRLEKGREKGHP